MSNLKILEFQYNMKSLQSKTSWSKGRILSSLSKTFHPNEQEMKTVFEKLDIDKDGKISCNDLKQALTELRKEHTTKEEVDSMMKVADSDGDKYINFEEFMEVHKRGGGIKAVDIRNAFLFCDLDGDGRIGGEDLLKVLSRLGEKYSLEDCNRMVAAVDTDGDKLVDMDDFMAMMTNTMKQSSA